MLKSIYSFVHVHSVQWTDSAVTYTHKLYYFLLILMPQRLLSKVT